METGVGPLRRPCPDFAAYKRLRRLTGDECRQDLGVGECRSRAAAHVQSSDGAAARPGGAGPPGTPARPPHAGPAVASGLALAVILLTHQSAREGKIPAQRWGARGSNPEPTD